MHYSGQIRCFCCGQWGWIFQWDRKSRVYCDNCRVENDPSWRTGEGRGQCQACLMSPSNHWADPRPIQKFILCVR